MMRQLVIGLHVFPRLDADLQRAGADTAGEIEL